MEIVNEDVLDDYILCHKCHTLHKKVVLSEGQKAHCAVCNATLYRVDSKLAEHGLALSITGFIFFVLANAFPLVSIEILGVEQFITIPKTFFALFESGFYIVGLMCALLIFVFPLMIFTVNIVLFTLFKMQKGEAFIATLLVLLAHLKPWSMGDIFLLSILIALVKLIGYAQIHMGLSFAALLCFVLLDLYISKMIHVAELWTLKKEIFELKRGIDAGR